MSKLIPISAVLMLTFFTAYAQDNTANGMSGPTTTSTPNSTDLNNTTTTTNPSDTTGTTGTTTSTTGVTTGTTGVSTGTDNTVTTTPVTTTSTPVTTTTTPSTVGGDTTTTGTVTPATSSTTTTPTTTSTTTTTTTVTPSTNYTCVGNNPNWNLSISKNLITFSTADNKNLKVRAATPITPIGDSTGNLQVFRAKTNDNRPVMILVRKNDTGCTTGAPGQSYQFDTFVVYQDKVVSGCCNPS